MRIASATAVFQIMLRRPAAAAGKGECVEGRPHARTRLMAVASLGYTPRDRCVTKLSYWTLMGTVNNDLVTVLLGCPSLVRAQRRRGDSDLRISPYDFGMQRAT